jgi:hypothetical protein
MWIHRQVVFSASMTTLLRIGNERAFVAASAPSRKARARIGAPWRAARRRSYASRESKTPSIGRISFGCARGPIPTRIVTFVARLFASVGHAVAVRPLFGSASRCLATVCAHCFAGGPLHRLPNSRPICCANDSAGINRSLIHRTSIASAALSHSNATVTVSGVQDGYSVGSWRIECAVRVRVCDPVCPGRQRRGVKQGR